MKKILLMVFATVLCVLWVRGDIRLHLDMGGPDANVGGYCGIDLAWDDPTYVPEIKPLESTVARLAVVKEGASTRLEYIRNGEKEAEYEHLLTPGEKVFTRTEYYRGKVHSITTWTYNDDGSVTMDKCDADGKVLERVHKEKEQREGNVITYRYNNGGVLHETQSTVLAGHGLFMTFEAWGTGDARRWVRTMPYTEGKLAGQVRQIVRSDGSWVVREWDEGPTNHYPRVAKETAGTNGSKPIFDANGIITNFTGSACVVEMSYEGHEIEDSDDFAHYKVDYYEPRTTREYVISSDGTVKPMSLSYMSTFIRDGKRFVIEEKPAAYDSAYGAPGNKRTTRIYHWRNVFAGFPVCEIDESGEATCYEYEDYEIDGKRMRIKESYKVPQRGMKPIPYETVTTRIFMDWKRENIFRRERWIELENGARELLDWTNWERDANGRVVEKTSSSGAEIVNEYYHGNLTRTTDGRGVVRNYEYDAINRMTHHDSPHVEGNMRYDLASQMTNYYGSVVGRRFDMSMTYDNAGHLADATSDEGEVYKTKQAKDGAEETYVNGVLKITRMEDADGWTTIWHGPKGRESPRWEKHHVDFNGKFSVTVRPRIGGVGEVAVTNHFGGAEASADLPQKPREKYAKEHGYWWREMVYPDGSITRRRISGVGDGSEETVTIDSDGRERRTLTLVDPGHGARVVKVTRPESELARVTIWTNDFKVMDVSWSGVTNLYERGTQGRLASHTDGRGGVTRYEYDARGRLVKEIDRTGAATRYEYDARGRETKIARDGKPERTTEYDAQGLPLLVREGDKRTQCEYDGYGQLAGMTITDGCERFDVRNFYDEPTGLLTNRTVNGKATTFGYDDEQNLVAIDGIDIEAARAAFTNALEIVRDEYGRAAGYSVAGDLKLTRTFDKLTGRVEALQVLGMKAPARLKYLAGTDLVEEIAYPNGAKAKYFYDAEDRLLSVTYTFANGEEKALRRFDYGIIAKRQEEFDVTSGLMRKPLEKDGAIYADFTGDFERPVARKCDDGVVRWCITDADGKETGVME